MERWLERNEHTSLSTDLLLLVMFGVNLSTGTRDRVRVSTRVFRPSTGCNSIESTSTRVFLGIIQRAYANTGRGILPFTSNAFKDIVIQIISSYSTVYQADCE
jgi:hypothetical protein